MVAESWLDIVCPLTNLEQWLRGRAGQGAYEGDFIAHWLGKLLFYSAPPWCLSRPTRVFALLVAASWVIVPPAPSGRWGTADGACSSLLPVSQNNAILAA